MRSTSRLVKRRGSHDTSRLTLGLKALKQNRGGPEVTTALQAHASGAHRRAHELYFRKHNGRNVFMGVYGQQQIYVADYCETAVQR